MKRLFYFTGYRLSVLHWQGKELVGHTSFEPTETGLNEFRHYLQQTENITGKFLVDVIEEDFRNEKIPHVGSKDRVAVINRLMDRFYRSSQNYSYHELIGRENDGRKDDIVLLGAMTNPQLIQSWLFILDECKVPLSGIWTLPLISKKILKTLKATTGVVLLVSQQVNSNVRQTLFRDGKLISSRQSIINQDIEDISAIGKLAEPEVNRTIDIHPIEDVQRQLGLKGVEERFSDSLFAWLCVDQKMAVSHYGERSIFNRFHNKLAATALYVASICVVIVSALLTVSNVSDAMEYEKSIGLLQVEETTYKTLYSKKFKDFEEVFENAGVMNAAVDLAEQITINGATSPLDFLISLSKILSQDEAHTLHIDTIKWQAVNVDDNDKTIKRANFTDEVPVKHDAIVIGRIEDAVDDYRASISHIQRIIQYLNDSPRVESVETLSMPVDLRSESKFSSETGLNRRVSNSESLTGVFSFKIIMKEPGHV
jgi:hypothetical protein